MITIVDYGAGNLTSVRNALLALDVKSEITADPEKVLSAERVIFPGVGAAGSAMNNLRASGLDQALIQSVKKGSPVLGICIGCQIVLEQSEEDGGVETLNLLPGKVVKFPEETGLKIPHMGWNPVVWEKTHPVFAGIPSETHFYFVHSYYPKPYHHNDVIGVNRYGSTVFTSAFGRDNLVCTQFHTEKSGRWGLQVLRNFAEWKV